MARTKKARTAKGQQFDYCKRSGGPRGFPYAVFVNDKIVAWAKTKKQAGMLAWALAAEPILMDKRVLTFTAAVTGLLGMNCKDGYAKVDDDRIKRLLDFLRL